MVSDRYRKSFGDRIVRLLTDAIPRFQKEYARFRDQPFRIIGADFAYVWNAEVPERHQLANNTLQAWIEGKAIPRNPERRKLLTDFFGVSLDYLFDGVYADVHSVSELKFRDEPPILQVRASKDGIRRRLREVRAAVKHLNFALDQFEDELDL